MVAGEGFEPSKAEPGQLWIVRRERIPYARRHQNPVVWVRLYERRSRKMAADSSFDVTSKIDRMELDNAINQAVREIDTRFDFKNTGSKIELEGEKILIEADTEERAKAALDVVKDKMIKRGVSLKHLDAGEPQLSGKIYKIAAPLKEGITTENAKKIAKKIRDEGPKSVKTQIQGDELRVTSKSRDDLQETMAMIKDGGWDFAVQFTNFR
jgi:cyclic-di-GMP-binding protein